MIYPFARTSLEILIEFLSLFWFEFWYLIAELPPTATELAVTLLTTLILRSLFWLLLLIPDLCRLSVVLIGFDPSNIWLGLWLLNGLWSSSFCVFKLSIPPILRFFWYGLIYIGCSVKYYLTWSFLLLNLLLSSSFLSYTRFIGIVIMLLRVPYLPFIGEISSYEATSLNPACTFLCTILYLSISHSTYEAVPLFFSVAGLKVLMSIDCYWLLFDWKVN